MFDLLQNLWQISVIVAAIAGAAVWLRSQLAKQRTQELVGLVDTRGKTISDLRKEVSEVQAEMAEMRGEMKFLRELKTTEIAEATAAKVVEDLLPFLRTD
jgi:phage shock protein A